MTVWLSYSMWNRGIRNLMVHRKLLDILNNKPLDLTLLFVVFNQKAVLLFECPVSQLKIQSFLNVPNVRIEINRKCGYVLSKPFHFVWEINKIIVSVLYNLHGMQRMDFYFIKKISHCNNIAVQLKGWIERLLLCSQQLVYMYKKQHFSSFPPNEATEKETDTGLIFLRANVNKF